jgi:hypothetical protein
MTTRLLARFDGKSLIPAGPVDLPMGPLLDVEVKLQTDLTAGSPHAILEAIRTLPPLSQDTADELEKIVAQSQVPAGTNGAFDDVD